LLQWAVGCLAGKQGTKVCPSEDEYHRCSEEWTSTLLPQLLQEYIYDPEDIYNADETGLYYRGTLDGSLCSVAQRKP